jgi:hypothetical protein
MTSDPQTPRTEYDRRSLTDDQRSLADDIASGMGWGHEERCGVWQEAGDGCSCPLLQAVADGLNDARVVEVVREMGYDPATQRGDRLVSTAFRPMPAEAATGAKPDLLDAPTLEQIESRLQRALNADPINTDLLWATLADVRRALAASKEERP